MSIGIMDEGYFTPRNQIIQWINNTLQLKITKIQQLGNGAIYCQLLDLVFPGKIPLNKINWKAKYENQNLANLKVLITSMQKLNVKKHIDIDKISKSKYQDNLQLAQWFKKYVEISLRNSSNKIEYKPIERRGGLKIDMSQKQPVCVKIVKPPTEFKSINLKKKEIPGEEHLCLKKLTIEDQQMEQIQKLVLRQKGEASLIKLEKIKQIIFGKNFKIQNSIIPKNDMASNNKDNENKKMEQTQSNHNRNSLNLINTSNNENTFMSANKNNLLIEDDVKSIQKSQKPRQSQNLLDFQINQ